MNILIITAHPNPQSFNAHIINQVQKSIDKSHEIQFLELYDERFDPVLHFY